MIIKKQDEFDNTNKIVDWLFPIRFDECPEK